MFCVLLELCFFIKWILIDFKFTEAFIEAVVGIVSNNFMNHGTDHERVLLSQRARLGWNSSLPAEA